MEQSEIQHILRLHHQAYDALMWMNREPNVRARLLTGTEIDLLRHEQSCERWLARHVAELPKELQPSAEDHPAFARMLSSFFATSFELPTGGPLVRRRSRLPKRKAREKNQRVVSGLQRFALQDLAEQAGLNQVETRADAVLQDGATESDRTLWSYVWELRRRCQFASQGSAIHQMWLALDPDARRKLTVEDVWSARTHLLARLRAEEDIE